MFTTKIIASLFLIAAAGVFDAERGRVGDPDAQAAAPIGGVQAAPSIAALRPAVLAALESRLRADLSDPTIQVGIDSLSVGRPNGAILAADGAGFVSLGAGGRLPVRFDADWNPATARLERVDYRVTPVAPATKATSQATPKARPAALRAGMRDAIAARVGTALRAEFANQPSRFELLGVDRVDSGRRRMVVSGSGITRFDGEGAAFTRFTATLDKFDGRVLNVDYELLDDAEPDAIASR
jgi:hypothetical protein